MALGRLAPNQAVYQSSGEATEQAKLPKQFESLPQPASPLASHNRFTTDWAGNLKIAPIVQRAPRMVGIRHLYARGATRQPIQPLGAGDAPGVGIAVWDSSFQPDDMGPIRDAGFNDALFQAGYPGFNLGLSFKVPTLQTQQKGQGVPNRITAAVNVLRRPSGKPKVR